MKTSRLTSVLACLLGTVLGVAANASPIVFTYITIASGTIGSTSFTNALITISAVADTSNIVPVPSPRGLSLDNSLASITIGSLGTFTFTTGTRFIVNHENGGGVVDFSRSSLTGTDLIEGPVNSAFSSWDMLTSIGPITGEGTILQWSESQCGGCLPPVPDVVTNGGTLVLFNASPDVTFSAVLAPVFAGTPGTANCHGKSVSALARQYGGLNGAAAALRYADVSALQNAILAFCED
jgi:hypothetical protein